LPALTASRRSAYSSGPLLGKEIGVFGFGFDAFFAAGRGAFLVGGKLSHRLRDLDRVGHEELLLRRVERHGRDVRSGEADDRRVQAVESMLRDDGRDLGSKTAG